jgi:hypothetical protein
VTYHPTWDEMPTERRGLILDRLRDAGVRWLRVDVSWKEFQPWGPGTFDDDAVAAFDARMAEISSRGFEVLLMFYWAPAWSTGTTLMNGRPSDPAAFGAAAAWVVQRWGAHIDALEVWNEPDTARFWAAGGNRIGDFAALLTQTSQAVRTVAPDLPLIGGGTSRVDEGWWRRLLAEPGVADSIDAIGVHPYTVPSDLDPLTADNGTPWRVRHIRAMAGLARSYDLPVWITEFGWSSAGNGPRPKSYERGVDEDTQAQYLTSALEVFGRFPWIDAAFWYTDVDHSTPNPHQNGFGLLRQDGSPKPAYEAMRCAASGRCAETVTR